MIVYMCNWHYAIHNYELQITNEGVGFADYLKIFAKQIPQFLICNYEFVIGPWATKRSFSGNGLDYFAGDQQAGTADWFGTCFIYLFVVKW